MTDYALFSDVQLAMNTQNDDPEFKSQIRDLIAGASRWIDLCTGRRFDHRQDGYYFDTRAQDRGGAVNGSKLILPYDLISASQVLNNETDVLPLDAYSLYPYEDSALYKTMVELSEGYTWQYRGIAGKGARVTGVWGYGGRWIQLTTLSGDINAITGTIPLTSGDGFEARQIARIDSEYIEMQSDEAPFTGERGVNGSTPAAHTAGTPVYVFDPDPLVKRLTVRIVKWQSALDDNPLIATVTVGDFQEPLDLTRAPVDVQDLMAALTKPDEIGAV